MLVKVSFLQVLCSRGLQNLISLSIAGGNKKHNLKKRFYKSVPDELVVIQEGCVFDQTEALLHSVDERLDLKVGHLVQWEEADASKHVQQVAGLKMESLQILKPPE